MELLSPPVQLGRGLNQCINLISSREDGFETGHFWFSLGKNGKIIILKIHITDIILPSHCFEWVLLQRYVKDGCVGSGRVGEKITCK